jgi:hypothetical protein
MANGKKDNFEKNLKHLRENEIITSEQQFTPEEEEAIASLSEDELQALVSVRNKLGRGFLKKYSHAILF